MDPNPSAPRPAATLRRVASAFALAVAALGTGAGSAAAQEDGRPQGRLLVDTPAPGATATTVHTFRPREVEVTDERVAGLRVPAGFTVDVWAEGLGRPRMLAIGPDGAVYVTRPDAGDVVRLADADGDGVADAREVVVSGIPDVHGLAIADGRLYLADIHRVWVARLDGAGGAGEPSRLFEGLPDGGQHANRTLAMGPDGWLYLTVGSLTNAVPSADTLSARMLRMRPDGSRIETYARNLRNTLGFGWHPRTDQLWGMDHGMDWLGDDVHPEELNRIERGGDYGWPYCYGAREPNPTRPVPPGHASREDYCETTVPMVVGYTAHAAPMQMAFYDAAAFPVEYRGAAFVAMRGSWNRYPPSGYEVVVVPFGEDGVPREIEPFATGWLVEDGAAHFGRPTGLAVAADGSLLVGDDTHGVIYRITRQTR